MRCDVVEASGHVTIKPSIRNWTTFYNSSVYAVKVWCLTPGGLQIECWRSLRRYIGDSLRLKVNVQKSAVDRPWNRTFLGFTFSRRDCRLKVSDKATRKLKDTIRQLGRRTRGHSFFTIIAELKKSLFGWKAYFDISEVLSPLRDVDKWIRRKLRCYLWKQWGRSGYRQLRRRGVERFLAWNTAKSAHGLWRLSARPYQVGFNIFFNKRELLRKLQEIFDAADAVHVYQATVAKCAYFVTTDRATILNPVEENLERIRDLYGDLKFRQHNYWK